MANRDHEAICQECEQPIINRPSGEDYDYLDDYDEDLEHIIHRHDTHDEHYQMLQVQADKRQNKAEWAKLKSIHHDLKKHIRPLLENAQQVLCEHGFHSGITEEIVTLTRNDMSTSFVVAVILHIADVPVKEGEVASKNIHSHNIIRFYRVAQEDNIECQFSNRKMQSRIFPLHSFHQDSRHQHHDSHYQHYDSQHHDSRHQHHDSQHQHHDSRPQYHDSQHQHHDSRHQYHDSRHQHHDSHHQHHDSQHQHHDSQHQQDQGSYHREERHTHQEIHDILSDFIRYILLSRRAEMVPLA
ncbi:hypothetical protein [uncultured Shewanella sp.]|uniref:hypothetical protein n=1 Tax=uncultured Shewanella sp. TaxID=173975 RepID=UPI002617D842|nr:hypothetical protein [uncultured Shewanella sp.]